MNKNKEINTPYTIFDPISGKNTAVNLDLMGGVANTENVEENVDMSDMKPVISREPK